MECSGSSVREGAKIVEELRNRYRINIKIGDFNNMLNGKILGALPEIVEVEKVALRVRQSLLILEVKVINRR